MSRVSMRFDYVEEGILKNLTEKGYSRATVFNVAVSLTKKLVEKDKKLVGLKRDKSIIMSDHPEVIRLTQKSFSDLSFIIEKLSVGTSVALSYSLRSLDKYLGKKGTDILDNYEPERAERERVTYIKKWFKIEEEVYQRLVIKATRMGTTVDKLIEAGLKLAVKADKLDDIS